MYRTTSRLLSLLLLSLLLLLSACGKPETRPPHLAILLSDDVRLAKVEGLKAGLADLGYPPGTIRLEVYSARGDRSQLPAVVARLLATRPDLIAAGGGIEAVALKESANRQVPVLMMGVASTVRTGLVDSLIRPGGLLTGLDNQHAELSAKRLELLVRLLPAARQILLIYDPAVVPGVHARAVTEEAAARLGITLGVLEAPDAPEVLRGLQALTPGEYDAVMLLPAFVLEAAAAEMALEFDRLRLPAMGPMELEAQAGLLASYGASMWEQGYQSARFVVKLLQGQDPALIPVETPDHPELLVDLSVARRYGLDLSKVGLAFARTTDSAGGDQP